MDWCWWLGCAAVDVICMYTMNLLLAALSIFTHPGLLADHTSMYVRCHVYRIVKKRLGYDSAFAKDFEEFFNPTYLALKRVRAL